MPAKKHLVILDTAARLDLERAARSNKRSLLERRRARILLAVAAGQEDATAAKTLGGCVNTVANVRRRFCQGEGGKSVRRAEQKRRKPRRLDGRTEAHLAALACSAPPKGRKTWSLHLLAGQLVEARVVDSATGEAVRRTLKKCAQTLVEEGLVHPAQSQRFSSWRRWKTCWRFITGPAIPPARRCAWTKRPNNS